MVDLRGQLIYKAAYNSAFSKEIQIDIPTSIGSGLYLYQVLDQKIKKEFQLELKKYRYIDIAYWLNAFAGRNPSGTEKHDKPIKANVMLHIFALKLVFKKSASANVIKITVQLLATSG